MKNSDEQIIFSKRSIKINENGIWIDLYGKPKGTQICLIFTSSRLSHCKQNLSLCSSRRICSIEETNAAQSNLSKYRNSDLVIKQKFRNSFQYHKNAYKHFPIITTCYPNNSNICSTI